MARTLEKLEASRDKRLSSKTLQGFMKRGTLHHLHGRGITLTVREMVSPFLHPDAHRPCRFGGFDAQCEIVIAGRSLSPAISLN